MMPSLYLRVEDVGRARLGGLDGCARWDALADARGYVGQAMLPVCVTGTMSWTATMYLTRKGQRIALPFQFVVSGR